MKIQIRAFVVCFVVLTMGLGVCAAQQANSSIPGIAHVAIRVADLEKSKEFYQKLGYQQAFAFDKDGVVTQVFLKISDRQFVEMYPRQKPTEAVGFLHLCFEVEGLQKLHDDYVAEGLTPKDVRKAGAGNLLFTMDGPENQNLEYTQYMPESRHMKDKGQHLGENRIAQEMLGVDVPMQDVAAAKKYYAEKLRLKSGVALDRGDAWFAIPGRHAEQVGITGSEWKLYLSVMNLKATEAKLKALGIMAQKDKSSLTIQDPDGNHIVFTTYKGK